MFIEFYVGLRYTLIKRHIRNKFKAVIRVPNTTIAIIWLVVAVILFILESLTVQLVCIWFAVGALVAMLAAALGASVGVQLLLFLATSIAVLLLWRPFLKKRFTPKKTATNADAVIGQDGIVIQEIDNTLQTGRISVNGLDWTARSADGSIIKERQNVKVIRINGVKLIVEPVPENEGGTN